MDSTDGAEVQETESNEVQENGGHSSTVWMQAEASASSSIIDAQEPEQPEPTKPPKLPKETGLKAI